MVEEKHEGRGGGGRNLPAKERAYGITALKHFFIPSKKYQAYFHTKPITLKGPGGGRNPLTDMFSLCCAKTVNGRKLKLCDC